MDQKKPLRLGDFGQNVEDGKNALDEDESIIHNFSGAETRGIMTKGTTVFFIFILITGLLSGYILSSNKNVAGVISQKNVSNSGKTYTKGEILGSDDKETYKDPAEGILKEGGIEGEGQYHLERPGGPSQYVYLTSSALDLSEFLNMKVKVWGQTNTARKAGWLMDAGRLQIL